MIRFLQRYAAAYERYRARIMGTGFREELIKWLLLLAFTVLVMTRNDFGYTETPYNFF